MRTAIFAAVLLAAVPAFGMMDEAPPVVGTQPATQPATRPALTREQITNLAAPIALFPDTVVTQILFAATNPADVATAQKYLADNPGATEGDIAKQSWHPSVKALARDPQLINTLAGSLPWTRALGAAFLAQRADVMAAIKQLRADAQAAAGPATGAPTALQPGVQQSQPAAAQQIYVQVPQSAPAYQPSFSYSQTTYGYPGYGYPNYGYNGYGWSYSGGSTVIIVGGGGSNGSGSVVQLPLVGGRVMAPVPPTRQSSTSQASFGYVPSAAPRGNVSPFVNAPAAPAQPQQIMPRPATTIIAPPARVNGT